MNKKSIAFLAVGLVAAAAVVSTIVIMKGKEAAVPPSSMTSKGFPAHPSGSDAPSKANVNEMYVNQVEQLKKSVDKHPDNAFHLTMLARLLMDGHQAAEAIPYFERAVKLQPKNDSLLLDLSVCYSIVKKYDASLAMTERLLKDDPSNLTALYNSGALYATMGKNDAAARSWKKILAVAPSSEEAKRAQAGLAAIGR